MKKNLLLSPILFGSVLFHTACVKQEITPIIVNNNIPQEIKNNTPIETAPSDNLPSPITVTPPPVPVQTRSGNYHRLTTVRGQTLSIEELNTGFNFPQYQGKIILLQIFGKTCEFCFEEMPIISKIHNQYPNQVEIIALQAQDPMSMAKVKSLIQQYHMNYPIIDSDEAAGLLHFITKKYEWRGVLPYVMLIKDGVTEHVYKEGSVSYKNIETDINSLL
jgi:thiol-disulfide isomerase/thioredoxin